MPIKKYFFLFFMFSGTFTMAQSKWDLQKCIAYAMDNNLTVQRSRLNIERSEVDLEQSQFSLLPNLNGQATYGYNFGQRIDPFTNQFASKRVLTSNLFLSSSLDLFNGFSKINEVKSNKEAVLASGYNLEEIKNDISIQICLAYLQILQNKENVEISRAQIALTQEQVDRTKILVDAGQSAQGSLYDIESQLAQEQVNLTNAENATTIARLNLTQLLQLTPEEAQKFEIVKPDLSDEGSEMLNQTSLDIYIRAKQLMPEIQSAEHNRASAEYAVAAARGRLYPNLSISGTIGTGYSGANRISDGTGTNIGPVAIGVLPGTGQTVFSLQDQVIFEDGDFTTKTWGDQLNDNFNQNFQFNLTIPLLNGLSARSNLNRAKINQIDANINYSQVSNQLRFEIEQAYADAKAAMNNFASARKAVFALEESFKYSQVRLDQGVINTVDYNNIKTQYANAQAQMINAKYNFVFRTKILDFYMGEKITL